MTHKKIAKLGPVVRTSDGMLAVPVTETGILTPEMVREAMAALYRAGYPASLQFIPPPIHVLLNPN